MHKENLLFLSEQGTHTLCTKLARCLHFIWADNRGGDKMETMLHEDLIYMEYPSKERETLLKELSDILKEKGYVKDSYQEAILEREQKYSTGLNTPGIPLAMPHAEAEHVKEPAILVAKLTEPVVFKEMGNSGNDVPAKFVFMLAVSNPEGHLATLSKFMSIFSQEDKLRALYAINDKKLLMTELGKILA